MAFRFQRRIKLAPGFRLNLSKSGASLSAGRRGFNVNSRGSATIGIPGTGLSWRQSLKGKSSPQQQDEEVFDADVQTIRRARSSPILIGVLSGFGGPLVAMFYAFRQKSWEIAAVSLVPLAIGTEIDSEKLNYKNTLIQLTTGLAAWGMVYIKKKEAIKQINPA